MDYLKTPITTNLWVQTNQSLLSSACLAENLSNSRIDVCDCSFNNLTALCVNGNDFTQLGEGRTESCLVVVANVDIFFLLIHRDK